jgi:hypothetical protein
MQNNDLHYLHKHKDSSLACGGKEANQNLPAKPGSGIFCSSVR